VPLRPLGLPSAIAAEATKALLAGSNCTAEEKKGGGGIAAPTLFSRLGPNRASPFPASYFC